MDGFTFATLLSVAAFLYINLFTLSNTPFLQVGDQVYFWVFAQRMLYGETVYRDFFQFTPPGTNLLYLFHSLLVRQTTKPKCWLPARNPEPEFPLG